MVRYEMSEITEGMKVGESVLGAGGKLLIASGVVLKSAHIQALREKGIGSILIDIEGTEEVRPEKIISEVTQMELSSTIEKSARQIRHSLNKNASAHENIHTLINHHRRDIIDILRNSGLLNAVIKIIDDIASEPWSLLNLNKMITTSEDLFIHTIQVTTIALCIGYKYRLSPDELKQLGLGAINYDIGLLAVPKEIIEKKTPLTNDEASVLKKHPEYGYAMLSGVTSIPPTSAIVILSHHEQQDGQGYPNKIKGDNMAPLKKNGTEGTIHRFAEIVAVADSFEMIANGRPHFSDAFGVPEAVRKLIAMSGTHLNADIVKTLLAFTAVYPVGARVRVSDGPLTDLIGCRGVIAKVAPETPSEPEIILYESKNGAKLKPIYLDTKKHRGFSLELL